MIRVRRDDSNKPEGFDTRAGECRHALAELRRADPKFTAGRAWKELKVRLSADIDCLREIFYGKCAFCEAYMAHVHSPHVEHYRPKGRKEFEGLMFVWSNWLLSCGRCNEAKWMHFPDCDGTPCLLDPTADDPPTHIVFVGEKISGCSTRGTKTTKMLGLDRSELEEERARWLMCIDALLLLAVDGNDTARSLLLWALQDDAPFTACARSYLQIRAPKLAVRREKLSMRDGRKKILALVEAHKERIAELV